jgi:hypothetical protein
MWASTAPNPRQGFPRYAFSKRLPALDDLRTLRFELPKLAALAKSSFLRSGRSATEIVTEG